MEEKVYMPKCILFVCGLSESSLEAAELFVKEHSEYEIEILSNELEDISEKVNPLTHKVLFLKGSWPTDKFMKYILKYIPNKSFMYHVGVFINESLRKVFFITDGAMNIHMDASQKLKATQGMIDFFEKYKYYGKYLGTKYINTSNKPVIGLITPSGKINPKISSSMDALYIQDSLKNQSYPIYIGSFDTLVSVENAKNKGITCQEYEANCLVCDNLDQANTLWKSLTTFGGFKVGGLVLGSPYGIVLTSRNDTIESKLFSLELSLLY